jgi:hypothetical protein
MFWKNYKEEEFITCKGCGALTMKSMAYEAKYAVPGEGNRMIIGDKTMNDHYCRNCKPPYDLFYYGYGNNYWKIKYIEVDQFGKKVKKSKDIV